ncbi:SHOCT domain-containing protein [Arthrobacter halodurans]|uniref:SHOCT domain-containing protein n=1 Tax=Arthrobacter halodurans TaxID=516699 RepID=A0ABV4UQS3_9MICC
MGLWDSFWEFFWFLFSIYIFIAFLAILFWIVGDLFRDKGLSGWLKALWIVALFAFPLLASLVYLIARGRGMAARSMRDEATRQVEQADYIRSVAGPSASDEIAKAHSLLDAGTITAEEYASIKEKALAT